MTKDEILALTIAELKLPAQPANGAVRWANRPGTNLLKRWQLRELRSQVTVKEVLDRWEYQWTGNEHFARWHFWAKLAKLGLTRLDHPCLPQSTLTLKVMRSLSKEEWRSKPTYLLGTLTPAVYHMLFVQREEVTSFTIQDLLRLEGKEWTLRRSTCWSSIGTTRRLLKKLGFAYEDGLFMQFDTLREQAERIATTHGISQRSAHKFVRVARAEGWLSSRLE